MVSVAPRPLHPALVLVALVGAGTAAHEPMTVPVEDLGEKAASLAVAVITATVLLSVITHGVSAQPLARRYGAVSAPAGKGQDSAPPQPEEGTGAPCLAGAAHHGGMTLVSGACWPPASVAVPERAARRLARPEPAGTNGAEPATGDFHPGRPRTGAASPDAGANSSVSPV